MDATCCAVMDRYSGAAAHRNCRHCVPLVGVRRGRSTKGVPLLLEQYSTGSWAPAAAWMPGLPGLAAAPPPQSATWPGGASNTVTSVHVLKGVSRRSKRAVLMSGRDSSAEPGPGVMRVASEE